MHENISKEEYSLILEKMPICCIDLIVVKDNKVLLVKRKNKPAQGVYWFPGGRLYKNETFQEAVKRKAKQEIGVNVKIIKQLGAFETIFPDSNINEKINTHSINTTFIVSPLSENIKLDPQSTDFKWISKIEKYLPEYIQNLLKLSGVFNAS